MSLLSSIPHVTRHCVFAVLFGGLSAGVAQTPASSPMAMSPQSGGMQSAAPKAMPSPPATADTMLNGKTIMVKYNAPAMRGRKVMDGLVPYGKIWRTGANPATSFVTAGDVMIGTLRVPAGSYTLFTVPGAPGTPWLLVVNKQTGQWGLEYHQEQDLGRTPMESATLPSAQESMSITFEKASEGSVQMHIRWETTDEYVTITPAS